MSANFKHVRAVWPWLSLTVILVAALYSDVSRFENPTGEKYMAGYYFGGQIDFTYAYLGARAFLAHENPYTTERPEFTHPVFRPELINGRFYKQLYPPGHIVTDVPLVLLFGDDSVAAGRFFFHLSLACLAWLSFLTWRLSQRIRAEAISPFFAFLAMFALTLQPGVQLGLERGQIDIIVATMCWTAVYLISKDWIGTALFLCVWATSVKGYPVLFGVGVGLIALRPGHWKRALAGTFVGLAVFVLPAFNFLGDSFAGTLYRSDMFQFDWWNQGFKNVVVQLVSVEASDMGRKVLTLLALLVSGLWAAIAWRHRNQGESTDAVLSWSMYATAALLAVIGYSAMSVTYNQILILPGILLLAANQDRVVELLGIKSVGTHVLGAFITLASYALFLGRWRPDFPLGGVGMIGFVAILGGLAVRTLLPLKRSTPLAQT